MSQDSVCELLKKHKGQQFTTKQLSDLLGVSVGSVTANCNRMRKSNAIKFRYNKQSSYGRFYYWYEDD